MEDLEVMSHEKNWSPEKNFWKDKKVLVTGHTGFKGAWISLILQRYGANLYGLSLEPNGELNLYDQLIQSGWHSISSEYLDIRDSKGVEKHLSTIKPDIIFHLAAQSLVSISYQKPISTWETNVIGSLNIMEAAKKLGSNVTIIMSTTDKVYENVGTHYGYREDDQLGGKDPYSASKASMELCVHSWRQSYGFIDDGDELRKTKVCTVRAGNVIGGGDYALNRLIPDAMRSMYKGEVLRVRSAESTRPWQHVLEPLTAYIEIAEKTHRNEYTLSFDELHGINIGPEVKDCRTVREVLKEIKKHCNLEYDECMSNASFKEAMFLSLSTDRAKCLLNWKPRMTFEETMYMTSTWYRDVGSGKLNALEACLNDIINYGL